MLVVIRFVDMGFKAVCVCDYSDCVCLLATCV